jgi:hypothetical protein
LLPLRSQLLLVLKISTIGATRVVTSGKMHPATAGVTLAGRLQPLLLVAMLLPLPSPLLHQLLPHQPPLLPQHPLLLPPHRPLLLQLPPAK